MQLALRDTCLSCSPGCGGGHSCPVVGRAVREMDGFHSNNRELVSSARKSLSSQGLPKDEEEGLDNRMDGLGWQIELESSG